MRLNTRFTAILFAVLLFTGIGIANASGLWTTESSKEPTLIKEGDFAGMSDPGDIRGSYSFGDIAAVFDVTPEIIAEAFGIVTDGPAEVLCKDLEAIYPAEEGALEIGTGSVRQFVAIYTGLPYDGDDGFPSTAIRVLRQEGIWTDELEAQLADRIVELGPSAYAGSESSEVGDPSEEDHEETIGVKGKTTVADALAWGLSLEEIEEVLGVAVDNQNMTIRDICTQNDLSFSSIKETLNVLLEE